MSAPLAIALVGSGSMGLNHARVIATGPQTTLAVVIDPSESVGRAVAERHGAALYVDEAHATGILGPQGRGLPSLAQTREVVDASRAAGTPLQCGLLERFNPAVVTALRMVEAPCYVRAERHSPYASRIRTGVGWDLLVHDVDLVVRAFGGQAPHSVGVQVGRFHPESATGAEDVVE